MTAASIRVRAWRTTGTPACAARSASPRGDQKYRGTDPRNPVVGGAQLSNDAVDSYKDWKLGATYDLGKASDVLKSVTLGGYYTKANVNVLGYGSISQGGVYPRNLGDGTFTVFLQKTF